MKVENAGSITDFSIGGMNKLEDKKMRAWKE